MLNSANICIKIELNKYKICVILLKVRESEIQKWVVIIFLLCGLIKFGTVNSYAASNLNKPKLKTVKETNYNRIKIAWENFCLCTLTDKNVQIGKAYKYSIKAYRTYKSKRLYSEKKEAVCDSNGTLSEIFYSIFPAVKSLGKLDNIWK